MKRTMLLVTGLCILLVLALIMNRTDAQTQAPQRPIKIAVLNVSKIIVECQEYLDKDKEVKEKQRELQSELEVLDKETAAIEQELKTVLQPGSADYKSRLKEWFDKSAKVKALGEYEKEMMKDETYSWTQELYVKLQDTTKRIARRDGYTLVMNTIDMQDNFRTLTDLYAFIRSRQIIYNIPEIDITAKVIEEMDADYDKTKK